MESVLKAWKQQRSTMNSSERPAYPGQTVKKVIKAEGIDYWNCTDEVSTKEPQVIMLPRRAQRAHAPLRTSRMW
jgi:hypothetical protein